MVLEINDLKTLRDIQGTFSSRYPFLMIEFYARRPGDGESFEKQDLIHIDQSIRNIKRTHVSALFEIKPDNTIDEVEKEFFQRFGLVVRVLSKSDTHWIRPEALGHLTLNQQNEIGRTFAEHIIHPDYDTRIEDRQY